MFFSAELLMFQMDFGDVVGVVAAHSVPAYHSSVLTTELHESQELNPYVDDLVNADFDPCHSKIKLLPEDTEYPWAQVLYYETVCVLYQCTILRVFHIYLYIVV